MTDLADFVATFAEERHCPSIAWGVVRDGSLSDAGGYGGATASTVFRIASMTKSFSAALTLLLRDEGALRLDESVGTYAPELRNLRSGAGDAPEITVRDLISMTSGLPTDDPWADRHLDLTDDEFDRIVAEGPLFAATTGTRFEYSNFGFAVLGRVVHRAIGERLQSLVTERLLTPLGMADTTWVCPDHDDWARPRRRLNEAFVDEVEPLGDGLIAPMGGLWTTVTDLARWIAWMDEAFPARDDPDDGPLCRASRREMQLPMRYIGHRTLRDVRSPTSYGFGLRILDEPELGSVVTHSGGLPGYGSNMRWLPGRRTGVVALANSTYAPMTELTARLLDLIVDGEPPTDARPAPDMVSDAAAELVGLFNEWDDDRATRLFTRSLIDDDPLDRRRNGAMILVDDVGELSIESVNAITAMRGKVAVMGASGARVEVSLMLAPSRPPRIQSYEICR